MGLEKFLRDWFGFGAMVIVVAAALYLLSPLLESLIGPERTGILQAVIVVLLAVRAVGYFIQFVGVVTRRKD
jgi:hypothetical protein